MCELSLVVKNISTFKEVVFRILYLDCYKYVRKSDLFPVQNIEAVNMCFNV
jgi:hypothetical protein